jgi:CDP-diacylglycerol---serine O-phosphatidyltransferase
MPHEDRKTHFTMLRSYRPADVLTLGNAAAGTAAIFAVMTYLETPDRWRVYLALWLLPLALVFDIADGRVARRQKKQSFFGGELDSLADIVSFGVAPATLGYALGMRGGLDVAILLFFVCCGISRLARYNVTAAEIAAPGEKVRYFEGTPIPSSLVLVFILGLLFHWNRIGEALPFGAVRLVGILWHPFSSMFFLSGAGMISKTLRIPKL